MVTGVVLRGQTYIGLLEVELGKTADVSDTINVNREFPEKINDTVGALREREPKDEGGKDDAEKLINEDGNLEGVKAHEFTFYLVMCQDPD